MTEFIDGEVRFGPIIDTPMVLPDTQVPRHLASRPIDEGMLLIDGTFFFDSGELDVAGATVPGYFAGVVVNERLVRLDRLAENPKARGKQLKGMNKEALKLHNLRNKSFFPETFTEDVDDSRIVRIIIGS